VRRAVERQGWTLDDARWKLPYLRQVRIHVCIRRANGETAEGVACAGGPMTGPIWSNLVTFDWER
jgi:hypothetical protein